MTLADVFLFLSYAEGFGLPALEAMAAGTALIASNATSIPEVVDDAGVLVSPQDTDEIAEALRFLCMNESARDEFGARGRLRATTYSWAHGAEALASVYRGQ
jgi:glycosyltransferase involved in cell wall biosynthesis